VSPHLKRKSASVVDSDAVMIGVCYRRGLAAYVEAGRRLQAKKEELGHGRWLPWLKANKNALGFEVLTAQRLMKLASENTSLAMLSADEAEVLQRLWGHKSRDEKEQYDRWNANDECYTPVPILKEVRKVLGTIDLDPASCAEGQLRVRAKRFYTIDTDALTREWRAGYF
jgi:hypothetical protein